MKRTLVASLALTSLLFSATEESDLINKTREALQQLNTHLEQELSRVITEQGTDAAMHFCQNIVDQYISEKQHELGNNIAIKRTALRYFNSDHKPSIGDALVMKGFKKQIEEDNEKPSTVSRVINEQTTQILYQAIGTGKSCTLCHGRQEADNEIVQTILKRYSNGGGFEFKPGDFRGAWVAEIKPTNK